MHENFSKEQFHANILHLGLKACVTVTVCLFSLLPTCAQEGFRATINCARSHASTNGVWNKCGRIFSYSTWSCWSRYPIQQKESQGQLHSTPSKKVCKLKWLGWMKFLKKYPKLTESTIQNFKRMYLKEMRKSGVVPCVTELQLLSKGRPPSWCFFENSSYERWSGEHLCSACNSNGHYTK